MRHLALRVKVVQRLELVLTTFICSSDKVQQDTFASLELPIDRAITNGQPYELFSIDEQGECPDNPTPK